ncbi:MAG: OB-fold domain-containing protein [Myxococcota bacterium]
MTLDPRKKAELEEKIRAYVGLDVGETLRAPDLVNEAMIRHWCVVMGDENPVYSDAEAAAKSVHGGIVAPPTMMNAWVMPPYIPPWAEGGTDDGPAPNKEVELHRLMAGYGYTGVVGTNFEDEYRRYVRPGERLSATKVIEAISEEKPTPLGIGYFIDVRWTYRDEADEVVGTELWRVLKYRPAQDPQSAAPDAPSTAPAKPTRLAPPLGHDNAWWWEGIERGELLIQRCQACGTLRHPPRPMCGQCQSLDWEGMPSCGSGTVYSYTVLHHPKVPGYEYPLAVALVELEEGTRIVANVVGCDPEALEVGMKVECRIEPVDGGRKLPFFHPAQG